MIRSLRHALMLVTLIGLAIMATAADWPQFLGPTYDGYAPDTGINKDWTAKAPQVLWKVSLSDKGYAGPSVADGKVFIIDHQAKQDILRAIDLQKGTDVWTYAYDDTDRANYGFARSTPSYDNGKLYACSRLGIVNCLDAKTGTVIWTRDIVKDFGGRRPTWDLAGSPFIDGDKVIVSAGGNNAAVVALNKLTGETIWQGGGSDVPGYATPVLATINEKRQYVVFTAYNLIGVDTETGKQLWAFPWKTGSDVNAANPIVLDNSVFITTNYGHGSALVDITETGAKSRWEDRKILSRFTRPIYADGYLYTTTESNKLICFKAATGETKWSQDGFEWGGLIAVDGTLIVMDGKNGDVAMVKLTPDGYQELGRIRPLGGKSWTAPIVADGMLIVRNESAMACISLK